MTTQEKLNREISQSGTGFMMPLAPTIRQLAKEGYVENLVPRYDHFECRSKEFSIYPPNITVDCMIRFENASDPDDQAILYAIADHIQNLKGLYVDSYGLYHDELSSTMLKALSVQPNQPPKSFL